MTADEQGEFVNITQSLRDLLDTVIQFLPKLVAFLVILIVGYFIAKLLQEVVDKVLEKVGFDRAVERGGVKKALEKSQYDASDILAKIVFYAVMLFVLSTAFGVFGPNPISTYLSAVIGYLPKVFVAILILVIASAVRRRRQAAGAERPRRAVLRQAAGQRGLRGDHRPRCDRRPRPARDRPERGQRGAVRQPGGPRRRDRRRGGRRRHRPDAPELGAAPGQARGGGAPRGHRSPRHRPGRRRAHRSPVLRRQRRRHAPHPPSGPSLG